MRKLLIADYHPLIREAVRDAVKSACPDCQVFEAGDLDGALLIAHENTDLDLMILDIDMPGMQGLRGLVKVRKELPLVSVAIITAVRDKQVALQAITLGASGVVSKSSSGVEIVKAIRRMNEGVIKLPYDIFHGPDEESGRRKRKEIPETLLQKLTPTQLFVLERMAKGESNKLIGYNLKIAESTVKSHVSSILRKLNALNRTQVILSVSGGKFDLYLR
jgi:DNA-binding NarL/FixJ family response regulator